MPIVAEGIEHEDQAVLLRAAGCELMQGYLYGKPMPPAALGHWIEAHRQSHVHATARA